jgi:hypothetical protein
MSKNKEITSYIELLKNIQLKNEKIIESIFTEPYEWYKGTPTEIRKEDSMTNALMYNALARKMIVEYYDKFMNPINLKFLVERIKKENAVSIYKDDIDYLNEKYTDFINKNSYNEHNTVEKNSINKNELNIMINKTINSYEEFKVLSDYVKNYKVEITTSFSFFSVNKIEMVSKNLIANYPSLIGIFGIMMNVKRKMKE